MNKLELYSPDIILEKPVDPAIEKLALSFLNGLNIKLEPGSSTFLASQINAIKYVKTGKALGIPNVIFCGANLSEIEDDELILAVLFSSWFLDNSPGYFSEVERPLRCNDIMLLDANSLKEACRSDDPQSWSLGYYDIDSFYGDFATVELPLDGYEAYIYYILSELDYNPYADIDKDYHTFAHPLICKFLDENSERYLETEI